VEDRQVVARGKGQLAEKELCNPAWWVVEGEERVSERVIAVVGGGL
jgi:hypothetical protein